MFRLPDVLYIQLATWSEISKSGDISGAYVKQLINMIMIFLMFVMLCACAGMDYVSTRDLEDDPDYLSTKSYNRDSQKLGAVRLDKAAFADSMDPDKMIGGHKKTDAERAASYQAGDEELFVIQRHKGRYFAETMVKKTANKRFFFSIGVDHRKRAADLGFRVEF